MKLFIIVLALLCVGTLISQPQATDSIACASVSAGLYDALQVYNDSSHTYINSGYSTMISTKSIIKRDSDYVHLSIDLEGTSSVLSPSAMYVPNGIQIENIQVVYEENALHVTWELPDTNIADKFHIFYAQAQIQHVNMLDSAFYWGMSYEDCWDWEIGENMYHYFYVIPKHVFPAYTSLIRIGIIAEYWFGNEFSTYSELFLAPDIVNRTLQAPTNVSIWK